MDAKYLCELLVILSGSRQPRSNVACSSHDLCTSCVQEGGFEGPENGPKQRRINNRLLSYRPKLKNNFKILTGGQGPAQHQHLRRMPGAKNSASTAQNRRSARVYFLRVTP